MDLKNDSARPWRLEPGQAGVDRWALATEREVGARYALSQSAVSPPAGALLLLYQLRGLDSEEEISGTKYTSIARVGAPEADSADSAQLKVDRDTWKELNDYCTSEAGAVSWIKLHCLDESIISQLPEDAITAYAIIEAVKALHTDTSVAASIAPISGLFGRHMTDSDPLVKFLTDYKSYARQLELALPSGTEGQPIVSERLKSANLIRLVSNVQRYKSSVEILQRLKPESLTIAAIERELSSVDARLEVKSDIDDAIALATRGSPRSGPPQRPPNYRGPWCTNPAHTEVYQCKHSINRCRLKNKDKSASGDPKTSKDDSGGGKAQVSAAVASLTASDDDSCFSAPQPLAARAYRANSPNRELAPNEALLDSGATEHMVNNRQMLSGITRFVPPRKVYVADDRSIDAIGFGTLEIQTGPRSSFKILNAWLVPDMGLNLISTDRLASQGLTTTFQPNRTAIVSDAQKRVVMTAQQRNCGPVVNGSILRSMASARTAAPVDVWHARLHVPYRQIEQMASKELVHGLDIKGPLHPEHDGICSGCQIGKGHSLPFPIGRQRATKPNELIHADLAGPIPTRGVNGERFWLGITDDFSGYRWIYLLTRKSEATQLLINHIARSERQTGRSPRQLFVTLRTDNGGEFISNHLQAWLRSKGIEHQLTIPYTPEQNGVAERANRTDGEAAATVLAGLDLAKLSLPASFWGYALKAVVHVGNRSPRKAASGRTPYELYFGRKPDISHLRVFGCEAFYHVGGHKFQPRARPGRLIGYAHDQGVKSWLIWDQELKKIILSRDATFRETPIIEALHRSIFDKPSPKQGEPDRPAARRIPDATPAPQPSPSPPSSPSLAQSDLNPSDPPPSDGEYQDSPAQETTDSATSSDDDLSQDSPQAPDQRDQIQFESPPPGFNDSPSPQPSRLATESPDPLDLFQTAPIDQIDRDRRLQALPRWQNPNTSGASSAYLSATCASAGGADDSAPDDLLEHALCYSAVVNPSGDLLTEHDALNGPHAQGFKAAYEKEMASHRRNGTWIPVSSVPKGHNIVGSRMLFKIKTDAAGKVTGYKCRLVAQGFSQRPGVDFFDTNAPTAKWSTIRIMLAHAAQQDLEIHHVDVDSAYLLAPLSDTIYMRLPDRSLVKLQKALYGLKQSAREWYKCLVGHMAAIGFSPTIADPAIFIGSRNNATVQMTVYVDDILLTAPSSVNIAALKEELRSRVPIKDLGQPSEFLGLQIKRDRQQRSLFIHQAGYISRIAQRFDWIETRRRPVSTPMDSKLVLIPAEESEAKQLAQEEVANGRPYATMLGCLMWAAIVSRPDIASAVSQLARFSAAPTPQHHAALKHVLRYLISTQDLGIHYSSAPQADAGEIITGVTDSDYAASLDTRRSRIGWVYLMAGGAISWLSRLQQTVATSTVHAEAQALQSAMREGIWLARALSDFEVCNQTQIEIQGDNQGSLALATKFGVSDRTKHFDVIVAFIRQNVESGQFRLNYVKSADNMADMLTKPLPRIAFQRHRASMGIKSMEGRKEAKSRGSVGTQATSLIPEASSTCQNIPEASRTFQNLPESSLPDSSSQDGSRNL